MTQAIAPDHDTRLMVAAVESVARNLDVHSVVIIRNKTTGDLMFHNVPKGTRARTIERSAVRYHQHQLVARIVLYHPHANPTWNQLRQIKPWSGNAATIDVS